MLVGGRLSVRMVAPLAKFAGPLPPLARLAGALPPLGRVRLYCEACWGFVELVTVCVLAVVRSGNWLTVTISVFEVLLVVLFSEQVHATAAELLSGVEALLATFTF